MANNRMFLVYRPTGDAVFLGKRMGRGWYGTPKDLPEKILELFRRAKEAAAASERAFSQDDFAVALEHGEHQPHAIDKWQYGTRDDDMIHTLIIEDSVPYGTSEKL